MPAVPPPAGRFGSLVAGTTSRVVPRTVVVLMKSNALHRENIDFIFVRSLEAHRPQNPFNNLIDNTNWSRNDHVGDTKSMNIDLTIRSSCNV
jgi:hypothetical protein